MNSFTQVISFFYLFPNRNYWILNLLSYLFKKSWDWVLRWVRSGISFSKKDFHQFSDIRCWWWGCWCWCRGVIRRIWWRQRVQKCSKEYEKDEETASSLYHLASRMPNWRSFWLLQGKKYDFTSCDGRRISDV